MISLVAFYTLVIFNSSGMAVAIQGETGSYDKYSTKESCEWAGNQAYKEANTYDHDFYWTCVPSESEWDKE